MALINRISRLVKADFHAVLDQIEEPEQLLKQAIRDMEDDLAETEQRIILCAHDQEALSVRKNELESTITEINGQLDLCFESDKEILAKNLIKKKLEAERLLKRLNSKFAANDTYLEEQRATLDENRAMLDSLRQKAELFAHRAPSHPDGSSEFDDIAWMAREMNVGDDEVEIAFLREKKREDFVMKRPSFFHGVIVAAVFAFFASAMIATLTPFVGFMSVIRFVIPALGLAYLLYLFSRSRERVGRVTTLALWSVLAAVTWWVAPPLPLYLLIHVGAMWLVRSLYFYSGVLPALMDLGLSVLSISAAVWAISQSGSVFLATWCFFLVQALFVAIPPSVKRKQSGARNTAVENEPFERARRQADKALTQLFSQ